LQDESKGLTVANGTQAAHIVDGVALAQWFYDANEECQILVQQTAAYAVGHADVDGSPFADPDDMFEQIQDGYLLFQAALETAYPGKTFPILKHGLAVWAYGGNYASSNPDYVDLHNADKTHLNDDSRLLKACIRFTAITNRNASAWAAAVATSLSLTLGETPAALANFAYRIQKFGVYPPTFPLHPANVSVAEGEDAVFTVEVRGSGTVTRQWYEGGLPVPGETGATYTKADVQTWDDGTEVYCIATNSEGSHQSATATLTVNPAFTSFALDLAMDGSGAETGYTKISSPTDNQTGVVAGVTTWPIAGTDYLVRYISGPFGANNNGITGVLGTPGSVSGTHLVGTTGGGPFVFDIEGLPQTPIRCKSLGCRANDGASLATIDLTVAGVTSELLTWDGRLTPGSIPFVDVTPDSNGKLRLTFASKANNTAGFTYTGWFSTELPP
jgi:hypothetical protein